MPLVDFHRFRRAGLRLCLQLLAPVFSGFALEAQTPAAASRTLIFSGMAWGIDSLSARLQLEQRGFRLSGTTRWSPAAFALNFQGKVFGIGAEVAPDFHETLGMRAVHVRFRVDSSEALLHFNGLLDSLIARHGRPSEVRRLAALPPIAFWGRVTTGTLLLTASDTKTITIAYRAPDPDAPARWRADSPKETDAPQERLYLSEELTEQPRVIYCPKVARHADVRGSAKFEFSLTKFGRLSGFVEATKPQHAFLSDAAERFLTDCAFAPGRINGFPVWSKVSMVIPFGR